MEKANNYVYVLNGKAYINLTNKCHNACTFCIRNTGDGVAGTPLWLKKEPTADEAISAFGNIAPTLKSDEVVFCGYGEPTEKLDVLLECARRLKAMGYKIRLNTNGLGSLVNGKNIAPLLVDFDTVSVSLNDCTPEKYASVTRSVFGLDALPAVIDFAEKCKECGINVVFTVVDVIGESDIQSCKVISERTGVPLRVREYISNNYETSDGTFIA